MIDVTGLLAKTKAEARPYQHRIVTKTVTNFTEKHMRSVLINAPTGSGKTVMALLVCKAMQELHGARIGWVSMRRNLLAQAHNENETKGFGVDLKYISMFDRAVPEGLDMLVVDEAQHDATGSMCRIHSNVKPRWTLGMTATPFRADRIKLCFDTVIQDVGIHRLIQEDYLSKYHHFTIPDWKPDTVADFFLKERERWGQSLIFFHRLQECYHVWHALTEAGVSCDVVSGETDCETQVARFRAGEIQVLVNCMKLTEGFDAKMLRTVFARPSIKSVTIQMCGRAFRKHPDIPFKQIVQSGDTKWPFPKTANAALSHVHVDGGWRTIEPSDTVEEVAKRSLVALAQSRAELPVYITKQRVKGQLSRSAREKREREAGYQGNEVPTSGVQEPLDDSGIQESGYQISSEQRAFVQRIADVSVD